MDSLYLSTGKAARALGVSADSVRRLCEAGSIQAETTSGGQWRVPMEEISRLKREGLPPIPRPLATRSRTSRTEDDREPDEDFPDVDHDIGLLAEPSDETVQAADAVVRLRSEVEGLRLKKERELALDFFRDREHAEAERQQAEAEEEAARAAEDEERQQRQRMTERWLEYALARIPWEAQGQEMEWTVHRKVKAALAGVDADESDFVIRRLVDGVVASVLRPWTRHSEIEQAIAEAVGGLPLGASGFGIPTTWEERAGSAARAAVERLRPDAPMHEVAQAAATAVQAVAQEFAAHKAAEADAAMRDRLLMWVPVELRDFSEHARGMAMQAVLKAFAALPVGTPREKLVIALDAALAPARTALAQHREAQRQQSEAERKQAEAAQRKQWAELEAQLRTPVPIVHRAPVITRRRRLR
jgi:excisionase family DNA binding protein